MRGGHPFKVRWGGRASQGILINPEMLKFKIPTLISMVPVNNHKSPRYQIEHPARRQTELSPSLMTLGSVKQTPNCQKFVQNFNTCVSNNIRNNSGKVCQYYNDYIKNQCLMK